MTPPGAAEETKKASGRGDLIAKIGTIVSAIIASSCCWLPPLLLLVGVSGAGMAKTMNDYRPVFIVVTFGFLGAAFYTTYRPRAKSSDGGEDCCSPAQDGRRRFNMMSLNKVMLWGITAMAVVFLFFPQYVTGLFGSDAVFTADMQRTVIKIDGMTCPP